MMMGLTLEQAALCRFWGFRVKPYFRKRWLVKVGQWWHFLGVPSNWDGLL